MEKKLVVRIIVCTVALSFGLSSSVLAMHIMEGFLPPLWCISWAALSIPFLGLGIKRIQKLMKEDRQLVVMLAMAGAFAFVLSSLKIPSVTGSGSHMTGVGFGAIMFGPVIGSVIGFIVLVFQALLLAHGGLTTLGANTFSMGVVGPLVTFGLYALLSKGKFSKKVSVFLAVALGDLATYITTSLQLAIAFPSEIGGFSASLAKFLGIFAITQVPLAIAEGILTVVMINVISTYSKDMFKNLRREELA